MSLGNTNIDAILADINAQLEADAAAEQARWRAAETDPGLRLAVLCEALTEALDEWQSASSYKGEYLAEKHGDAERIAELRALVVLLGGAK